MQEDSFNHLTMTNSFPQKEWRKYYHININSYFDQLLVRATLTNAGGLIQPLNHDKLIPTKRMEKVLSYKYQ